MRTLLIAAFAATAVAARAEEPAARVPAAAPAVTAPAQAAPKAVPADAKAGVDRPKIAPLAEAKPAAAGSPKALPKAPEPKPCEPVKPCSID